MFEKQNLKSVSDTSMSFIAHVFDVILQIVFFIICLVKLSCFSNEQSEFWSLMQNVMPQFYL